MNKVGIHYGCFVDNWLDDQYYLIEKTAKMGFEALEIGSGYLLKQDEAGIQRIRDCAAENGIKLIMSLGMAPEHDISSEDSGIRLAGIRALQDMAAAMASGDISDCCGVVYCEWNRTAKSPAERRTGWKNSIASMKEAVKAFEDNGVYIDLEPTNRFENSLINCCRQAVEYAEEVGSANIGIHLDTFHINIEENSFAAPIFEAGERLRYFHIGENNRKIPGTGMLPWRSIFDALVCSGYEGPVVMEPFIREAGEIGLSVSLYREIADLSDYENDLVRSLGFVRNMLEK